DGKIDAPLRADGSPRLVRYIKFRLGFPSSNSSHNGSAIYRIYAIGDETQFTNVDEEKWPKLEFDSDTQRYVLTGFSGDQTVFDTDGKMLEQKDRRGLGVTYQYQGDRLIKIVYPGNAYMAFEYDTNGFLNSIKDSTGRETQIVPDGNGQVKEVVYPDATRREFDYDERGLMTMDKKGIAAKTYSWHSEWPVLTSVTLPNGGIRTVDAGVLKYLLSDPAVNSDPETPVDFPFLENNDGFDSEVTYEDGKVVRYEIGKGSKTIYVNDELEETTTWANKRKNRIPVKIESGADKSELTTIRYNNNLQVERITNSYSDFMWQRVDTQPNTPWVKTDNTTPTTSANTTYTYNADRLVSRVTGYDIDMSYTYDGNSNLLEEKNLLLNKTTKYTYNSDNVLIRTEYPDGKQNQLMYNEKSLLIEIVKNDGTKTVLTRNSRGEVKSITDAENRTFNVERDIMGRVVKETAPSGRTVQYVWSSIGCSSCGTGEVKLTKIVDSGNNEWEFKYDIMGNATDMIYPDGSKITQGYDIANRLTSFTNKRNQLIRYAYDSDGLMVKKTTPEGITDFSYDDKDRLVEVSAPDYHYKYQYGIPGGLSGHTVLQVNNVNTAGWSQHIYNRFGFPTDYYDSFQWHKTYLYNFSHPGGTPIGLAPSIVSYSKWYSSAEHRLVYTYNSGHRLYSKRNDYLKTMKYFSY
ncbi:MAG: RHS repeat protein, partial [bacterium]|nr:RHS repeat protein [bacterium]